MPGPVRVLIIEDNSNDAALAVAELRRGGFDPDARVIRDREEAVRALDEGGWEVVIADYRVPQFDAPDALAMLKQRGLDLPFLVMSGAVGEAAAVAIMRAVAHDFFDKGHMALLPVAVERELHEAEDRRMRREAEARYRALFEESPDGILLLDPETMMAIDFNDTACRQLGYSREEFAKLAIADYEAIQSAVEIRARVAQVLRNGRADFETRHRTRSGEVRLVHVTVRTIVLAGKTLIHSVHRDITEQKQAEDSLHEAQVKYRSLVEAANDAILMVDAETGVLLDANKRAESLLGEPAACLVGRHHTEIYPPECRRRYDEVFRRVALCRKPLVDEMIVLHRSGRTVPVESSISVVPVNGNLIMLGILRDITERKQAGEDRAELRAAGEIQQHLLPHAPPSLPGYDIAGRLFPAEFAAGDHYDYLPMRDGTWGLVVADVTGHRYGSALLMASTRAYLRSMSQVHTSVGEILELANDILVDDSDDSFFVTLFLGRLNPRTGCFLYSSAGHESAFVLDASGERKAELASTGIPLGILPETQYVPGTPCTLEPGDLLLLVTDGLKDAASPTEERFGIDRILDVVRTSRHKPAKDIIDDVYRAICCFCLPGKPDDDITMIVVKATG